VRWRRFPDVAEAGENPTIPPVSPSSLRGFRPLTRAAVSLGHRRPFLRAAFWPGSAPGFMLQPHEALFALPPDRIDLCVDGTGHDLCARGERRHQDLFGSADSRRCGDRSGTRAGLLDAIASIAIFEIVARSGAVSRKFPISELPGDTAERLHVHQSGERANQRGARSCFAPIRYSGFDGRRTGRRSGRHHQPHLDAGSTRHTHRGGDHHEPGGQSGVQLDFGVSRHASGTELPGKPASSHAALTTACTPGGLHGG